MNIDSKYYEQRLKKFDKIQQRKQHSNKSDTIGGIYVDASTKYINLAASSGGPWLKHVGRIGSVELFS